MKLSSLFLSAAAIVLIVLLATSEKSETPTNDVNGSDWDSTCILVRSTSSELPSVVGYKRVLTFVETLVGAIKMLASPMSAKTGGSIMYE